jgi:hypothetical protein
MSSQLLHASLLASLFAAVLVLGEGCKRRDDYALASDACTTAADIPPRTIVVAPPVAADVRAATAPTATAAPPPSTMAPPAAADASVVEAPLAPWAPSSAPLTVVHAPDLARNLGLTDASAPSPPITTPAPAPAPAPAPGPASLTAPGAAGDAASY